MREKQHQEVFLADNRKTVQLWDHAFVGGGRFGSSYGHHGGAWKKTKNNNGAAVPFYINVSLFMFSEL